MEWSGLALLLLVGAGIVSTGLPAAFILIGAATLGALLGIATGTIPLALLSALPNRLVNLLENDLLQALPLYVTMGLLLGRLPVADALYRSSIALLPKRASAPLVSGMVLGALLGPMNGSVGASVLGLSRVVAPRLTAQGVPAATRDAVIAVAATLGVLVPPSLVLILLGDAMLSAHTTAVTVTGRSDRVINTQDVFHAALVPAGIFLVLCFALAWFAGRGQSISSIPRERPSPREIVLAAVALAALLVLLGGVATGYFYAVEAAAMGAFALLSGGLISGHLRGPALRELLHDAIAITGALFALGNAVLFGSVTAAVRGMTTTESAETLTMYQMVFLTLFFTLALPVFGFTWPNGLDLTAMLVNGLFNSLGQYWWTRALSLAPPSAVGPFYYFSIVWALALGFLFWADILTLPLLAGAAIVVCSGLFLLWHESGKKPLPAD